MNPFEVLGVAPTATDAEIRQAYLRKANDLHPDHASEESTRAMQELNAAYDMLRHRDHAAPPPPPPTYAQSYAQATAPPPAWATPRKSRVRWAVVIIATLLVSTCLALLSGSGSHRTLPHGSSTGGIDLRQTEGECLTFDSQGNPDEIVDCTRPHGARIMRVVAHGTGCPIWTDRTVAESAQDLCLDTHQ